MLLAPRDGAVVRRPPKLVCGAFLPRRTTTSRSLSMLRRFERMATRARLQLHKAWKRSQWRPRPEACLSPASGRRLISSPRALGAAFPSIECGNREKARRQSIQLQAGGAHGPIARAPETELLAFNCLTNDRPGVGSANVTANATDTPGSVLFSPRCVSGRSFLARRAEPTQVLPSFANGCIRTSGARLFHGAC
jgi:hypothetical protein